MNSLEWIAFDLDDTLLEFAPGEKKALHQACTEAGLALPENFHELYQNINKPFWKQLEQGLITVEEIKKTRFRFFQESIGYDQAPVDAYYLNNQYLKALAQQAIPMEGMFNFISRLSEKYHLAILTNGLNITQRSRIRKAGLEPLIQFTLTSEEADAVKPDKAYFRKAWELMGKPDKNKVLMVGDGLDSDITGALSFGFNACWMNPLNFPLPEKLSPALSIRTLGELNNLLNS